MSWFFIAVHLFLICQNKLVWSCDKIQYESGTWSIRSFSLESNRLLDDLPLQNCVAKVREQGKAREPNNHYYSPTIFREKTIRQNDDGIFCITSANVIWSFDSAFSWIQKLSFLLIKLCIRSFKSYFQKQYRKRHHVLCNRLFFEKSIQIMILYQFTTDIVQNTTFCSFGNILKWSWDSLSNTSHTLFHPMQFSPTYSSIFSSVCRGSQEDPLTVPLFFPHQRL